MADDRSRHNVIPLRVTDREMLELSKLAAADDRKLAEFVHFIVRMYLFGHVHPCCPETEVPESHSGKRA